MLISQYANLPENCDGFWVEKLHNKTHGCSFLVYHRGLTEFCDSISKAKKALRDRRASLTNGAKFPFLAAPESREGMKATKT